MTDLIHDIRYGFRTLLKRPGFTILAVLTLALGIGATTSIFSVINGVVLQPLPFDDPGELVQVWTTQPENDQDNWCGAKFIDVMEQSTSFEELAGLCGASLTLTGYDLPRMLQGVSVTSNWFEMLGIGAWRGRVLSSEIDLPGGNRVVVLRHSLWLTEFGGDEGIIGRSIELNGEPYTVVGILAPGVGYPERARFWASSKYRAPDPPFDLGGDPTTIRGAEYFSVFARLDDGASLDQAALELEAIGAGLREQHPEMDPEGGFNIVHLRDAIVGDVRSILLTLFGAVGFVLLIACANVANLLLVRASGREREISVRMAIGATRTRVIRQLVTESAVLAVMGGLLGLAFAFGGTDLLLTLVPEEIPRMASVAVDWTVLGFTMFIALSTGILFGLVPAFQSSGGDLMTAVREGGGKHTAGRSRKNLRNSLIVGEVAISLILLVGAGLMVRTFMTLNQVHPGFDPVNVHTARVWIPESRYGEDALVTGFYREVIERLEARPEVEGAAAVLSLPIDPGITGTLAFSIMGRIDEPGQQPVCGFQLVSADYFRIMGIPLLSGRALEESDNENAPRVAVINQALAEEFWPGENPLGKQVTWGDPSDAEAEWTEIVGVVGSTRFESLDSEPRTEIFRPYSQDSMPFLTMVVNSRAESDMVFSLMRQAVAEIDSDQPVTQMAGMEEILSTSLAQRRFNMQLLGLFSLVALIMAAVGLYGVLSYTVAQRSGEIGIRIALGAGFSTVISLIVRDGFRLVLIGLAAGLAGALLMVRVITNHIYGIDTYDPASLLLGIVTMAVVALAACLFPAWRAARVDPMVVLNRE